MHSGPPEPAGLAGLPPEQQTFEDLLASGPARSPDEVREQMNASLGIGVPRQRYRDGDLPPVDDLRQRLEL